MLPLLQARPHIMQRIEAYSTSEIRFNLMALVSRQLHGACSQLLLETQGQSSVQLACSSMLLLKLVTHS